MDAKKSLTTPILIGLLVVASFFVGTLYTKVQIMEQTTKNAAANQEANNPSAANVKKEDTQPTEENAVGKVAGVSTTDHVKGAQNPKITLIEYSDYECPFCARFHATTKEILDAYGDSVALVYRHFPLSFHQNSEKLAEASECIADLGGNEAFWNFTDRAFDETNPIDPANLGAVAAELGVDQTAFNQCLDNGKFKQKVADNLSSGQTAGIQGTPGTVIMVNGEAKELIPGALPFDQVKPMLDKYLD
ncbi:thioredoxin domain-containing protein [Candidatus Beckwithbacteria bacterium]|nr:thioredoxin domain-containing protein [Candidatus Beckwithbacteria bacterium]